MATNGSQFSLLKTRRFGPFFVTQFLGALNDNIFRNGLLILVAFQVVAADAQGNTLTNLAMGLFVLPFFIFSATAGQLADKFEKSRLIRLIKIIEIILMTGAAIGFYFRSVPTLLALLFLMGMQSAFFGPIKFGILPQCLREEELVGGNGWVEMGTFVAILLGTIIGGVLMAIGARGGIYLSLTLIVVALVGYSISRWIPIAAPVDPTLKINWEPISQTLRVFHFAYENRTVFLSILGISWFWFFGAIYLAQLPNYTRLTLGGNEQVATVLLAVFSIGIGIGSLLCERLSGRMVELGLVPLGSIGLTAFGIDLFFAQPNVTPATLIGAAEFMNNPGSWRIIFDIVMLGVFGGFYIVPLYALVQQRSERSHLSRIIAANNILNSLLMVIATAAAIILLRFIDIPQLLLWVSIVNAVVAIYIYSLVPEFLMRFIVWFLVHMIYRVRKTDLDHIPDEGAAVLVCNHVSFVDALVIGGSVRRPVRFVMYHKIFKIPVLSFVFRTAKAIPIAPQGENPEMLEQAYDKIAAELEAGHIVCLFPEGHITQDGEIQEFRRGIERIIERTPVPVIPVALKGLWGSFFSRYGGAALRTWPRKLWARVGFAVGEAVPPELVTAAVLQERVTTLRGEER